MTNAPTDTAPTSSRTVTDEHPVGLYTELLSGLHVAAEEQRLLDALLDEIQRWVSDEDCACYHVAVFIGQVCDLIAIEAIKRTTRGAHAVTRLFPVKELYERRLGIDAPVLGIAAAGRDRRGHHQERYALFQRPD